VLCPLGVSFQCTYCAPPDLKSRSVLKRGNVCVRVSKHVSLFWRSCYGVEAFRILSVLQEREGSKRQLAKSQAHLAMWLVWDSCLGTCYRSQIVP